MKLRTLALVFGALLPVLWTGLNSDLAQDLAAEKARTADLETRVLALQLENERLLGELTSSHARLVKAEAEKRDWLQFAETLTGLKAKLELPDTGAESVVQPAAPDPAVERAKEMVVGLRNLFKSEGLFAYDLLAGGRMQDGALGPVVFRLLDDRGRLAGSLSAASLVFEAGNTGRVVTMILGAGVERRGGVTTSFESLRLPFVDVDPGPWIARVPELFPTEDLGRPLNDGLWQIGPMRARLNKLLAADASHGYLRLDTLGGVSGEHLFTVDFVEVNAAGKPQRHLFADSVRLAFLDRGVVIEMFGCVSMRGNLKTPFPGGLHRVFLPRASQAEWTAAKLPGLPHPAE